MEKLKDWLWAFKENKPAQLIIAIILGLLVLGLAGYFYFTSRKQVDLPGTITQTEKTVTPSQVSQYPVAVVVENLVTVRPQSGLSQADIVYEALAEGGITRFLAIYFFNENIAKIGPVRSARSYFVDWAEEYHGLFAHVGGSPQALGSLNEDQYLIDLNQFYNSAYYWRDTEIAAPHNLLTSSEKLTFAIRDKAGDSTVADYAPWSAKAEAKPATSRDQTIDINFSSDSYAVKWQYDYANNQYLRFNGGAEHKDANTDKQISAKNVLVQYVDESLLDSEGRLDITTVGENKMLLFQDGGVVEGTWKKAERGERTLFYDAQGEVVQLNTGATWVEVVPSDHPVTY